MTAESIRSRWEEGVPLAPRTTWKIGGAARWFFSPENSREAVEAYRIARAEKIPLLVLGNGSNLVISDRGWDGLVLSLADRFDSIDLAEEEGVPGGSGVETAIVRADSGASLHRLVIRAVREGWKGVERLAGIPGTVGGAAVMNAGAFGQEWADRAIEVTACDREGKSIRFSKEEAEWGYRTSRFRREEWLITEVKLRLERGNSEELYAETQEILRKRKEKQPLELPNGGSLFQRPPGDYAGRLIEEAGLKGFRIGDVAVSTKHAGFAVNLGEATGDQVKQLTEETARLVEEKFGVRLVPEQLFVGEFSPFFEPAEPRSPA